MESGMNINKPGMMERKLNELVDAILDCPYEMKAYMDLTTRIFTEIAPILHVASCVANGVFEPNAVVLQGEKGEYIIFDSMGKRNQEAQKLYTYNAKGGGQIDITVLPVEGHVFSEEEEYWLERTFNLFYATAGRTRFAVLLQKALEYDLMTGIANLTGIHKRVQYIIGKGEITDYNAYYFNCKNFKYINNTYGYMNGSNAIIQYAARLKEFTCADEIVGRLGGDNFIAIIKRTRTEEFLNLISGVEINFQTNAGIKNVRIAAVVGGYEIPQIQYAREIMMPISTAIQAAKEIVHEDCVFYTPQLGQKIRDMQKVLMEFSVALEKGEIEPYWQPKVDGNTGEICGVEALARWKKDGEFLSPAQFIPALERDGRICQLDMEIFRQICCQITKWLKAGITPPKVSFNLSCKHLKNPNLFEDIKKIIEDNHTPPKYLELEITETSDYNDYDAVNELFAKLRELGMTAAIDDFGTGFSSLNLLLRIDFDVLKIDREFVRFIGDKDSVKERKLLLSILDLAEKFGIEVVAEGVETQEQLSFLMKAGCNVIQGFYYFKPMPTQAYEDLFC